MLNLGGRTRVAAVIGDPIRHSLSPAIHNAAFAALGLDWVFVAFSVPAGRGADAIAATRTLGLAGLSVTMPLKGEVAAALDHLTPDARALGAANAVSWEGDGLVGDNTDGPGLLDSLRLDEGFDPAGRRCAVLGAGGAARAVVRALARAGAQEIIVVNRTPDPAQTAAALAPAARVGVMEEISAADLVVHATPVGMRGVRSLRPGPNAGDGIALDPDLLHRGQLVVDLVYDPPVTPLVEQARARGAAAVGGLGMLIHQAAHAFRRWTGEDPPLEVMSAAALAGLARAGGESSRRG